MSYCSIEDAWRNSDNLTDQFKLKKKNIESFTEESNTFNYKNSDLINDIINQPLYTSPSLVEHFNYNSNEANYSSNQANYSSNQANYSSNQANNSSNQANYSSNQANNKLLQSNSTHGNNTNKYQEVFICDDFLDHLETCTICRNKMRMRFKSKLIDKCENLLIDNKDTILLFLIILFALLLCKLIISIFR
jgi:hypothetical protein